MSVSEPRVTGTLTICVIVLLPHDSADQYRRLNYAFEACEREVFTTNCTKPEAELLIKRFREVNVNLTLRARWIGESDL